MNCPECGRKMALIDNTSFMREGITGVTPMFTHYGCEYCNRVIPIDGMEP